MRLIELTDTSGSEILVNIDQINSIHRTLFGSRIYLAGSADPLSTRLVPEAILSILNCPASGYIKVIPSPARGQQP